VTIPLIKTLLSRFRASIARGDNWYCALLEAAREWSAAEEEVEGIRYRYLIAGEALDLFRLSERLIQATKDLIPEQEQLDLLFHNRLPIALTIDDIKEHLGEERFGQYLNYFYGITIEEAIQEMIAEEVRKEERGIRARADSWVTDEAFQRIYGKTQSELIDHFRAVNGYATDDASFVEMKEFGYWLSKYRLTHSDPEKSASDTKKALVWLKRNSVC